MGGAKVKGKWGRVFSLIGKWGSAKKAADVARGLGKASHEPAGLEGATFIKRFQTGDFGGVVTKSYPGEDGLKWHRAVYEGGDAGDLEAEELGPLLSSPPRPNARGGAPLWLRRHTRPGIRNLGTPHLGGFTLSTVKSRNIK